MILYLLGNGIFKMYFPVPNSKLTKRPMKSFMNFLIAMTLTPPPTTYMYNFIQLQVANTIDRSQASARPVPQGARAGMGHEDWPPDQAPNCKVKICQVIAVLATEPWALNHCL